MRGYEIRDGMLVHIIDGDMIGEEVVRIVVPQSERGKLLELAHEKGGHLGVRKVRAKLNRLFTWPGMGANVTNHVASCQACALHNKAGNCIL